MRRDGFALIGVLWLVVLISVVGLDFSLRARGMSRQVINGADHAIARAAAEGGLLHAEDRLVARLRETEGRSLGEERALDPWANPAVLLEDSLRIGDAACRVLLEDAGTRVHLNVAAEDEIRRLLAAVRVDDGDADRVAQAIMDWRDLDDLRRTRGAERDEYVQADAPVLPANGPFGSVDELRLVTGVTEEIYDRVAGYLTTSGSGRVNVSAAPAEVLSALPGMSDGLLAAILRARGTGVVVPDLLTLANDLDDEDREMLQASIATLMPRVTNTTQEVRIASSCARMGSSLRVEAIAIAIRAQNAAFLVDRALR
jgi:general secretion pathway protein K